MTKEKIAELIKKKNTKIEFVTLVRYPDDIT